MQSKNKVNGGIASGAGGVKIVAAPACTRTRSVASLPDDLNIRPEAKMRPTPGRARKTMFIQTRDVDPAPKRCQVGKRNRDAA